MQYGNNPRKVHGKVKIIYSDSDISNVQDVNTSGNGVISSPEQVYQSNIAPTIKACTMDGNAYMGQGYQMNGNGLITGWWSDVHSDSEGFYINPPSLTISFISRPIIKWTVIGDVKLNQYPVDFNVTAYLNESVADIRQIRGNDEVSLTLWYDDYPLTDITAMKIEVLRWNKPNAKVKLLQFFDILEEEYGEDDFKDFEVLDELSSETYGYSINSDTATFTLFNKDRKFDRGYLKSLLLLGRKVIPYLGIEKENRIEYTKLGTFYSDEWTVPQNDLWVKLKCTDRLMRFQNQTYLGYPYTLNASLYDIAEDILINSGLSLDQYSIDEALREEIVYNAYIKKCTCWDALQEVCYAGLCYAYADRDDVIVITKEKQNATDYVITADNIFSYDKNTMLTDFCNYIEVKYSTVVIDTSSLITAYEKVITIDPESTLDIQIDYSTDIADAVLSYLPSVGIELLSYESGMNASKTSLHNHNSNWVTLTVKIQGYPIKESTETVTVKDDESISEWGKFDYAYRGSNLIQSYEQAELIGLILLNNLKQGNSTLKMTWRGNPGLKLQDAVTVYDRFGEGGEYKIIYNRFKYDGSLKQETKSIIAEEVI